MWEHHLPPPPKQQYRPDSFDPFEEAKANKKTPATVFLEAGCRYHTREHIGGALTCLTHTHGRVSAAAGARLIKKGHRNPPPRFIFQIEPPRVVKEVLLLNKTPRNIETATEGLWNS